MRSGPKMLFPRSSWRPSLNWASTSAAMASECSGSWSGILVWLKRVPSRAPWSQCTSNKTSYQPSVRKTTPSAVSATFGEPSSGSASRIAVSAEGAIVMGDGVSNRVVVGSDMLVYFP